MSSAATAATTLAKTATATTYATAATTPGVARHAAACATASMAMARTARMSRTAMTANRLRGCARGRERAVPTGAASSNRWRPTRGIGKCARAAPRGGMRYAAGGEVRWSLLPAPLAPLCNGPRRRPRRCGLRDRHQDAAGARGGAEAVRAGQCRAACFAQTHGNGRCARRLKCDARARLMRCRLRTRACAGSSCTGRGYL